MYLVFTVLTAKLIFSQESNSRSEFLPIVVYVMPFSRCICTASLIVRQWVTSLHCDVIASLIHTYNPHLHRNHPVARDITTYCYFGLLSLDSLFSFIIIVFTGSFLVLVTFILFLSLSLLFMLFLGLSYLYSSVTFTFLVLLLFLFLLFLLVFGAFLCCCH